MKKNIKINKKNLQLLIKNQISETIRPSLGFDEKVNRLIDSFYKKAMNDYDPSDPSIQSLESWRDQVSEAANYFEEKLNLLVDEVLDNLGNGIYFK